MNRGPYDRESQPFPGEPFHVQYLALFPDENDFGVPYFSSSRAPLARPAPLKPAPADALEPSSLSGASARGHNRKA